MTSKTSLVHKSNISLSMQHHSGRLGDLSDEQEQRLLQLWQAFIEIIEKNEEGPILAREFRNCTGKDDPDATMLRFLRARVFKVPETLKMLVEVLKWRLEYKVEDIVNKGESMLNPFLLSQGAVTIHKTDKAGRPVLYFRAHLYDLKKFTTEDAKAVLIYMMEQCRNVALTPEIDRITVVFYMGKFGLKNFDYNYISFLVTCLQNNYPEMLHQNILVDAPVVFSTVWPLVKKLLAPGVAEKVKFMKSAELHNEIDVDNIPVDIGGTDTSNVYVPARADEIEKFTEDEGLKQKYMRITETYMIATKEWIMNKKEEDKVRRSVLQRELYTVWKLIHSRRIKSHFQRLNLVDNETLLLKWK